MSWGTVEGTKICLLVVDCFHVGNTFVSGWVADQTQIHESRVVPALDALSEMGVLVERLSDARYRRIDRDPVARLRAALDSIADIVSGESDITEHGGPDIAMQVATVLAGVGVGT